MLARRPWLVLLFLAALLAGNLGATPAPAFAATLPVVDEPQVGLDP